MALELLKDANMEDIMEFRTCWKLETISNITDALHHLKRPVDARSELALGMVWQGRNGLVQKLHPNPIAHTKSHLRVLGILVQLGLDLSLH